MIQSSVGDSRPTGLGKYRFREVLSTSFFGSRYHVLYDAGGGRSDPPAAEPPAQSSMRPRPDLPLAMRLVQAEAPSLLEQLARSAQAVRELEHPALLRPFQIVRSSTRLGIVTPNLPGITLAQLLEDASARQECIPPAAAIRIVSDVLSGLEALRDYARALRLKEFLYGGLTPDSIFIGLDGQARLIDPGVASAAARQPSWSHEAAALAYTSPEQTGADPSFDARSDTFSIGVILWELLTSRPLFGAATAAQTLERLHRAPIPRVQRHQFVRGEPIAFALAQTVAQALRRELKYRYPSYAALSDALAQAGDIASAEEVAEVIQRALLEPSEREAVSGESHEVARNSQAPGARAVASVPPPSAADAPRPSVHPLSWGRRVGERAAATLFPGGRNSLPVAGADKPTAFPVGDLSRRPAPPRRNNVLPLVLSCAAALGLIVWAWPSGSSEPGGPVTGPATQLPPPAAAAPPDLILPGELERPDAAPKPSEQEAAPDRAAKSVTAPDAGVTPSKPRKPAAHTRAPLRSEPRAQPEQRTFIPEDI